MVARPHERAEVASCRGGADSLTKCKPYNADAIACTTTDGTAPRK